MNFKILIAEDEFKIREVLCDYFRSKGDLPFEAENGEKALEMAQGLEFDAVNENLAEVQQMFNNDTRKVYADLYIDDKAIPHTMSPSFWAERLGLSSI